MKQHLVSIGKGNKVVDDGVAQLFQAHVIDIVLCAPFDLFRLQGGDHPHVSARIGKAHLGDGLGAVLLKIGAQRCDERLTLSDALRGLTDTGYQGTSIKEVILAAPDINTLEFEGYVEPRILERFKFRTTVYVSTNDFPLKISRYLHEYPRLGDPTYERYIQRGVEVVDTSSSSPMRRSWGHSYVWDNPAVTADLSKLINLGRGASSRALTPVSGPGALTYWVLD